MSEKVNILHPGYYVKDAMEELEMSQHEFAARLGVTDKFLSTVLNGQAKITVDFAAKLSQMFGTSIALWINLQTNYETKLNEQARHQELIEEREILKMVDPGFLIAKGVFTKTESIDERILKLRRALPIANLCNLRNPDMFSHYRLTNLSETLDNESLVVNRNVWLSLALFEAKKIDAPVFDEERLRQLIPKLRNMTKSGFEEIEPELHKLLSACGVKLVIMPYLKHSRINGLVRWMPESGNYVVALNGKGKYMDIFWFTLFHELGHVFQKDKRRMIIDEAETKHEEGADSFASQTLIPASDYALFIHGFRKSKAEVLDFAEKVGIHPGIVVGRLHHDLIIGHPQMNDLREKIPSH